MTKIYHNIKDEDFCAAYAQAASIPALALALGVPQHTVRNKIANLTTKGIQFPRKARAPKQPKVLSAEEKSRLQALAEGK